LWFSTKLGGLLGEWPVAGVRRAALTMEPLCFEYAMENSNQLLISGFQKVWWLDGHQVGPAILPYLHLSGTQHNQGWALYCAVLVKVLNVDGKSVPVESIEVKDNGWWNLSPEKAMLLISSSVLCQRLRRLIYWARHCPHWVKNSLRYLFMELGQDYFISLILFRWNGIFTGKGRTA
jgi:hypothetical protein